MPTVPVRGPPPRAPWATVPPFRFLGTYHPRLDDKGRLFLPAKFRERLADGLVITVGQERCLCVYPDAEFDVIFDRVRQAPVTSKAARDYQRMFMSHATDETPDKQGRVTVNQELRTYAGLTRDCAVIGAGTRLEIWDDQTWTRYSAEQEERSPSCRRRCCPA